MARATADAVRTEIDVSADEYPSEEDDGVANRHILDRWIRRAAHVVDQRVAQNGGADDIVLEDLEILVAAHFAYPHLSGKATGERIASVSQGSASVNYETNSLDEVDIDYPGGYPSTYFGQAVALDRRMAEAGKPSPRFSVPDAR